MTSNTEVQIVWFKRDLRLGDHRPLLEAAARGPVIALYVIEPELWRQPDRSLRHWNFLLGCLGSLDTELASLGGGLTIRRGEMTEVLAELRRQYTHVALWAHEETGTRWTFDHDLTVHRWCKSQGVRFTEYPQFGVTRALDTRDGWSRRWAEFMYDQRLPVPDPITFIAPADGLDIDALPSQGSGQSIDFATPPGR